MENHVAHLYAKIVLPHDTDFSSLPGSVELEIDAAYTIGKSIAVLKNGSVMGHLERRAARLVWRFLRAGTLIEADVYVEYRGWRNQPFYSILSHSYEIGVDIRIHTSSRDDAKLLLTHITRRKLIGFPGISVLASPENLKPLVNPVKDENGVSSVLLACLDG